MVFHIIIINIGDSLEERNREKSKGSYLYLGIRQASLEEMILSLGMEND